MRCIAFGSNQQRKMLGFIVYRPDFSEDNFHAVERHTKGTADLRSHHHAVQERELAFFLSLQLLLLCLQSDHHGSGLKH